MSSLSNSTPMPAAPTPNVPSSNSDPDAERYHPDFNSDSPEVDIVLRSQDGTLYRIPSFVLRSSSGFFRSMLSLPPPEISERTQSSSPIPIPEPDVVLERMLRLISGLEIPPWASFPEMEAVMSLADSWEAPGPMSIIRNSITAPQFLADPLRLYAIATRFDWSPEAKLASEHTLNLNLYDSTHEEVLSRLSARHLLALLRLHRSRRDAMRTYLDDPEAFNAGNMSTLSCRGCGLELDQSSWRELKAKVVWDMERRPSGDTICGMGWEMEEWVEARRCWDAKCRCGVIMYDKGETLRKLRDGVESLPKSI